MDRHHADGVDVGLGQHRLGDARLLLALVGRPGQVRAQAAVGDLGPGAGLVDDEPQPAPRVAGARAGGADLEHAPVLDEPGQHLAGREPPCARGAARQVGERPADRAVRERVVLRLARRGPPRRRRASSATGRRRRSRTAGSAAPRPARAVAGVGDRARRGQQVAHLGAPGRPASSPRRGKGRPPRRARPRAAAATCATGRGSRCRPARPARHCLLDLVEDRASSSSRLGAITPATSAASRSRSGRRVEPVGCASAPRTATGGPCRLGSTARWATSGS